MSNFKGFVAGLSLFLSAGCAEESIPGAPGDPPGSKPWTSDDVACSDDDACGPGETCLNGVCQMQRCAEDFESRAPLGKHRYLQLDSELAVVGDQSYVDGFEGADYLGSWDLSGLLLRDLAGGNLTGTRPHTIAAAIDGLQGVRLQSGDGDSNLELSFEPTALASGDVDADGVDELFAVGESFIAQCDVRTGSCSEATLEGAQLSDVSAADVDGDGYAEVLMLESMGDQATLYVWNVDASKTGQEELLAWTLNKAVLSLAAGDLDGNGAAEVLLLEDGGYWGWASDKLHVFSPQSENVLSSTNVDSGSVDVTTRDDESDGIDEVHLLRDDRTVESLSFNGSALVSYDQIELSIGTTAQRIASFDWDGDSPAGRLLEGPELISGETVPVALLVVPPTELDVSDGFGRVTLGNVESQSVAQSEMLALTAGLVVSYGADLGSIAKAKVQAQFERETVLTRSLASGFAIGQSYALQGDKNMLGGAQAGVVLSCGCFHHYSYVTEDPAGKLGPNNKPFEVLVPVGGQVGLWSLSRYNRMAEKLGTLPVIPLASRVGDVDSYATEPLSLDGQSIPTEDMLFPELPPVIVSDVGRVGWSASIRESETNTEAQNTKIGVGGSLGAFGVELQGTVSTKFGTAYSLTVGQDTNFGGEVPPIVDNSKTPEDEFETSRYSFTPFVYRQHYQNAAGEDAAFYVIDYAVNQ
jgi:hypothetical protein